MDETEITIYVWKESEWEMSAMTGDLETAFVIVNFHHMRGEQVKMVTYHREES